MSSRMAAWFAETSFDEEPEGVPALAPEEDDEGESEGKKSRPFGRRGRSPNSKAGSVGSSGRRANLHWGPGSVVSVVGPQPEGVERATLRAVAEQRVARLEADFARGLELMWGDQEALVVGRLRGRKTRMGTRHWETKDGSPPVVTKAIDPDRVLDPRRVREEAEEFGEGIALHVVTEAAGDAARRLQVDDDLEIGPNSKFVRDAVAAAVARITAEAEAKAQEIRDVILAADASGAELDEIVETIRGTYAQRRAWAANAARTHTNALVNRAGLAAARAAGVSVKQWLSSHDERVRPTHRVADGQVRHIEEKFRVGAWELDYPADGEDLPASAEEVMNCRCSMLFGRPSPFAEPKAWQEGEGEPDDAELARMFGEAMGGGEDFTGVGPLSSTAGEPIIGYRTIDRRAIEGVLGERITAEADADFTLLREQAQAGVDAARVLGAEDEVLLEIEVPAGTSVLHAPGGVEATIFAGATFEVVAVSETAIRLRLLT